ncbi:FUSC family membrane protein [Pedobacter nyackensis]|uniref:Uncharacterized membrane protein YccC n=1 Tax=Pedobacter nyackensis TaxID=475255 RepID=A0A1W2EHT0_9SPHI|nr:FUSC family membrane protein [Pedobacter nyackensis]SMD09274.1 Uncharacterized membrane protein YccC [Pedobacter nyackensis]
MAKYSLNLIRSEYFSDALRTTLSIIIPFCALYYFTDPHTAIAVGVGALLISLTDMPGTLKDKMVISICSLVIFFVVSLLTAVLMKHLILMGLMIIVFCFIFSMFTALGPRFSLLGTMALIIMTFVQGLRPIHPLSFSLYIVIGGIWYYTISLLQTKLWPLSSVRHALGECIISTADFLRAKANFYQADCDIEANYLEIIKLHNKVSEKQEQVRHLLLRDKQLMQEDHDQGQRYLWVTTQIIDLYELISAIQYNYESLHKNFKDTGLLESITEVIKHLANDLQLVGAALFAKSRIKYVDASAKELEQIKQQIAKLVSGEKATYTSILLKLQNNIEDIYTGLRGITHTLSSKRSEISFPENLPTYQLFTGTDAISFDLIKNQLHLKSPIFRFALRLTLACVIAYGFMLTPIGFYSYWILLTVIVVIKPGFGLTKRRNIQRLQGTFSGVFIGIVLLALISNIQIQLIMAGFFLLGYFVYLRINYALCILFLTPMVIICLSIYDHHNPVILQRAMDTIIGCAIAFATAYLFPSWEIKKQSQYIKDVINANLNYLLKLHDQAAGIPSDITSFKLARKEVYTKLAVFSSGLQNMLLEPKQAQGKIQHLYQFQILSHQLSSTIASFFPFTNANDHLKEIKDRISQAMEILQSGIEILDGSKTEKLQDITIEHTAVLDINTPGHLEYHKIQQILLICKAIKKETIYLSTSPERIKL